MPTSRSTTTTLLSPSVLVRAMCIVDPWAASGAAMYLRGGDFLLHPHPE